MTNSQTETEMFANAETERVCVRVENPYGHVTTGAYHATLEGMIYSHSPFARAESMHESCRITARRLINYSVLTGFHQTYWTAADAKSLECARAMRALDNADTI